MLQIGLNVGDGTGALPSEHSSREQAPCHVALEAVVERVGARQHAQGLGADGLETHHTWD